MKNKKILFLIILTTIVSLSNIYTVNAKKLEYTCTYEELVEGKYYETQVTNQEYSYQSGYVKIVVSVYSGTTTGKETEIEETISGEEVDYFDNVSNWKNELEWKVVTGTFGGKTSIKNIEAYTTENLTGDTAKCPAYILRYKGSGIVVSDSLNELQDLAKESYDQAKKIYKDYVILKEPTLEKINVNDTEQICKANTKSDYSSICLYQEATTKNVSLIGYISDSGFMIKSDVGELVYGSPVSSGNCYSNYKNDDKICKLYKNDISITTTCPPMIIKYLHAENDYVNYWEITYVIGESKNLGSVDKTYYLITDGGKRDASTCEVQNQTGTELPIGTTIDSDKCEDLISEDLMNLINKILKYVRIAVPLLIIVLGMMDFGRAVLASKEEEMKKAQSAFVKRLIIGVAIFLLPTIINLLLDLANTAWKSGLFSNSDCGLK